MVKKSIFSRTKQRIINMRNQLTFDVLATNSKIEVIKGKIEVIDEVLKSIK